jgi:hypothetical protein
MAGALGCASHADVDSQFVYGEVDTTGFAALLQWLSEVYELGEPKFADLGSGTGRSVLIAASVSLFAQCIGLELVAELHEVAAGFQREYDASKASTVGSTWASATGATAHASPAASISLVCGCLFEHCTQWLDADVVFINWVSWQHSLRASIVALLLHLPHGAVVITVSHPIDFLVSEEQEQVAAMTVAAARKREGGASKGGASEEGASKGGASTDRYMPTSRHRPSNGYACIGLGKRIVAQHEMELPFSWGLSTVHVHTVRVWLVG